MSQSAIPQTLKYSLFALGLFAFTGIFLHQGSVYLWAMIFPAVCLGARNQIDRGWFGVGLALVCCWMVFPLSNAINFLLPHPSMLPAYDPSVIGPNKLMKSLFPATWIGSGLMLMVLCWQSRPAPISKGRGEEARFVDALGYFWMGISIATILFGIYFVLQYFWGIDFRGASRFLGDHNRMGARFRVPGFYGHPLTLGSIALAWSSFFVWLATSSPKILKELSLRRDGAWILAACNLVFVLMSGGRVVAVLCLAVWAIAIVRWTWVEIQQRQDRTIARWVWFGSIVFLAIGVAVANHLSHRMMELVNIIEARGIESIERVQFWRVYLQIFKDSMWFGQGEIFLRSGLRDAYYEAMGLGNFHQKYNAHNFVIEILACTGVLGFGLIVGLISFVFRRVKSLTVSLSASGALSAAFGVALCVNLMHGMTQNTLFDASLIATYATMFWLVVWSSVGPAKDGY